MCLADKGWSYMIAEDKEVTIQIKHAQSKKDEKTETPSESGQNLNASHKGGHADLSQKDQKDYCKSSWITHMMSTDQQMYNNVRDYIVTNERIGSLLKDNGFKQNSKSQPTDFLIRIRTKWPRHAICANTTVMQFHEMGIALKAHQKPWGTFAQPQNKHKWPAYSSIPKLLSEESKIPKKSLSLVHHIMKLSTISEKEREKQATLRVRVSSPFFVNNVYKFRLFRCGLRSPAPCT